MRGKGPGAAPGGPTFTLGGGARAPQGQGNPASPGGGNPGIGAGSRPGGALAIGGGPMGGARPGGPPRKGGVPAITERELEAEVLRSELPVFLAFMTERSPQCKAVVPELEALAQDVEGKAKVVMIDVEKSRALATQLRIQSVPTFMVFDKGRPVDAVAGAIRKAQMREMIEPFLPRAEGALKAPELAQLLKAGAVVAIDTRDKSAFDRAHLPGAKHMPLDEVEGRLAELHMHAGQPVLYCRAGDKTKELAARLAEAGMPVAYLEGGLLGWESEGLPVERP